MQAARGHLESMVPGVNAAATPRVGVFPTSPHWDAVLGLEANRDTLDMSIGETAAICFRSTAETRGGHDSRAELRKAAEVLRKLDINRVLVLCSGRRTGSPSGTLFIVEDHVNWSGDNPLIGMRSSARGERFVDMSGAYDRIIRTTLHDAACDAGVPVESGVAVDGPRDRQMSTPEAHAVVTGLAPPVIVARQAGARVGAVAWLEGEQSDPVGTPPDVKVYGIEALRRFLEIAVLSVTAHTGV